MREKKFIYFENELTDEFSKAQIQPRKIDEKYSYDHWSKRAKAAHFFWYRVIARPLARVFLKLKFGHKIIRDGHMMKGGYFMYGNHTNAAADALIPTMLTSPADAYVIVHANNVSMPVLGRLTPYMGAIPLPDEPKAARNFMNTIKRTAEENPVVIYPEAHIWPYYTKIRPFTDASFRYPVQYNKPVYCFTNTYQKRPFRKTPRIVTYVDGPFYPNETLMGKERRKELRDRVYNTMVNRSANNNVEMITYIRKE